MRGVMISKGIDIYIPPTFHSKECVRERWRMVCSPEICSTNLLPPLSLIENLILLIGRHKYIKYDFASETYFQTDRNSTRGTSLKVGHLTCVFNCSLNYDNARTFFRAEMFVFTDRYFVA